MTYLEEYEDAQETAKWASKDRMTIAIGFLYDSYADAAAAVRDLEGVPGADIGFVHTTEPLARGRPAAEPRPTPLCARRSAAARDCWRGLHSAGRDQRQPEGLAGFQLRPINDNSDPRRLGVRGPRATLQAQAFRNL
jgi:hypothetical protein